VRESSCDRRDRAGFDRTRSARRRAAPAALLDVLAYDAPAGPRAAHGAQIDAALGRDLLRERRRLHAGRSFADGRGCGGARRDRAFSGAAFASRRLRLRLLRLFLLRLLLLGLVLLAPPASTRCRRFAFRAEDRDHRADRRAVALLHLELLEDALVERLDSMFALSVSTSARRSPDLTRSPGCLSHLRIFPPPSCRTASA
jgi:hypothetical protein